MDVKSETSQDRRMYMVLNNILYCKTRNLVSDLYIVLGYPLSYIIMIV